MEPSRVLAAVAVALALLNMVEYTPASFVPGLVGARGPASSALRGTASAASLPGAAPGVAPRGLLQGASAILILAAVGSSLRGAVARRPAARGARLVRQAEENDAILYAKGPIVVYTKALITAAEKCEESVQVSKDVLKIRQRYVEEEWLEELLEVINEPEISEVQRAEIIIGKLSPLESTVLPKYIRYLGKKRRLVALGKIANDYVQRLYESQSVAPVKCFSSDTLTDEEKNAIKAKMCKRLGVSAVKLICYTDKNLLGGFKVEYGYTDPDTLLYPAHSIDLTLKTFLTKSAINQGVLIEV